MTRIVVDTNLIVAGRWRKNSASNRILGLVLNGVVEAVYSPEIKDENLFILGKVKPPKDYVDRVLRFYRKGIKVKPRKRVKACRDPSDNRFLEAAVDGKAEYVISSDRHLLEVGEYEGVRVLKPTEFMRMIDY